MQSPKFRDKMTNTSKTGSTSGLHIIPHIAKCLRVSSEAEMNQIRDTILPSLVCTAAKSNNVALLKEIKDSGVNFAIHDYNIRTALHVAATMGNFEAVKYLISIGLNVHLKDRFGFNPLLCAVKAKSLPCVEVLRKAGGTVDIPKYKLGVELCRAAAHGDIAQLQCWKAAVGSLSETDYDKRTALHVAVNHNQLETIRYLMDQGLSAYAVDEHGATPISEAKRKNFKYAEAELTAGLARRRCSVDVIYEGKQSTYSA